ncbi:MAG: ABC transporter substrate-binding protein [Syntrophomonas sp.]|nr:ABC transporter substrate-binding protein [Syntrophomonas sp.]
MRRRILALLILGLWAAAISGCQSIPPRTSQKNPVDTISFKVAVLRGPTALGMVKMLDSPPNLGIDTTAEYVIEQSPDTLSAKLLTGEIAVAAIPTNLAAKLFNKGVNYQLAAMNTWGVLYVVTNDESVKSWPDLKGQQIDNSGQGAATDVVLRYLLAKNGIDPNKDVIIKYVPTPAEQAQLAIAGRSKITVLPEPWVSTVLRDNKDLKIALDMQQEWTRIHGADVPFAQTCLVVNADFAVKHPAVVGKFLDEYAASIAWVNQNPAAAGEMIKKQDIGIPAEVAASAIPRCNLRYMDAVDAKPAIEKYLQVLLDFSPDSIGGKLPDAQFYYQK